MAIRSWNGAFEGLERLLTPREVEVLGLASRGLTNARLATELGVTVHAVKFHLASVYRKLGVANRTEAAAAYVQAARAREVAP